MRLILMWVMFHIGFLEFYSVLQMLTPQVTSLITHINTCLPTLIYILHTITYVDHTLINQTHSSRQHQPIYLYKHVQYHHTYSTFVICILISSLHFNTSTYISYHTNQHTLVSLQYAYELCQHTQPNTTFKISFHLLIWSTIKFAYTTFTGHLIW